MEAPHRPRGQQRRLLQVMALLPQERLGTIRERGCFRDIALPPCLRIRDLLRLFRL